MRLVGSYKYILGPIVVLARADIYDFALLLLVSTQHPHPHSHSQIPQSPNPQALSRAAITTISSPADGSKVPLPGDPKIRPDLSHCVLSRNPSMSVWDDEYREKALMATLGGLCPPVSL
jgi:hypothetical protein